MNTWDKKPAGIDVDVLTPERSPQLGIPTLYVGSSFVWSFAQVSRDLEVLSPSLVYFYDESVMDVKTQLTIKKVVPFTDDWRRDTFSRRLLIVAVLETYLPYDGEKFLGEIEREVDEMALISPTASPDP
jgi:hypothetical protein